MRMRCRISGLSDQNERFFTIETCFVEPLDPSCTRQITLGGYGAADTRPPGLR